MSAKEHKRKLHNTSIEQQEQEIFQKSKILTRSPERKKTDEMEQVLKAIQEMRTEIKEGFKNANKQTEELKEELGKTNWELGQIKREMNRKEEEWHRERKELELKIQTIEEKLERQDRDQRRNNIIIKNANISRGNIEENIEKFLTENLDIKVQITDAFEISKGILLAKVHDWTQKKYIMENKRKLQGTAIYIENDLTISERKIQKHLRAVAKQEKEKGNTVKVGYKKITIGNVSYQWNEVTLNEPEIRKFKAKKLETRGNEKRMAWDGMQSSTRTGKNAKTRESRRQRGETI